MKKKTRVRLIYKRVEFLADLYNTFDQNYNPINNFRFINLGGTVNIFLPELNLFFGQCVPFVAEPKRLNVSWTKENIIDFQQSRYHVTTAEEILANVYNSNGELNSDTTDS